MLVFPERVLKGAIPNRDFLHLYGPGSLWALAGVFKVFGVSLLTERVLRARCSSSAIVFGVYALAAPWGRTLAVGGARSRRRLIIIPFGLTALAWVGAVGLGAAAASPRARGARDAPTNAGARRWAMRAGLLLGCRAAVPARPRPRRRPRVGRARAGHRPGARATRLLVGRRRSASSPYVVHVATAGPGQRRSQGMVLDPVFHLRGGRSLPIPPPWGHSRRLPAAGGRAAAAAVAAPGARALAAALHLVLPAAAARSRSCSWQAWQRHRQRRPRVAARPARCSSSRCSASGILPQALQRVDSAPLRVGQLRPVRRSSPSRSSSSCRRGAPTVPTAPPRARRRRVGARSCSCS